MDQLEVGSRVILLQANFLVYYRKFLRVWLQEQWLFVLPILQMLWRLKCKDKVLQSSRVFLSNIKTLLTATPKSSRKVALRIYGLVLDQILFVIHLSMRLSSLLMINWKKCFWSMVYWKTELYAIWYVLLWLVLMQYVLLHQLMSWKIKWWMHKSARIPVHSIA